MTQLLLKEAIVRPSDRSALNSGPKTAEWLWAHHFSGRVSPAGADIKAPLICGGRRVGSGKSICHRVPTWSVLSKLAFGINCFILFGERAGARTQDPVIKSQWQVLSYQGLRLHNSLIIRY